MVTPDGAAVPTRAKTPNIKSESVAQDGAGKYIKIDTAQELFDKSPIQKHPQIARKFIKDNFRGKTITIDNNNNIYFGKPIEGKYTTKPSKMDQDLFNIKMRLAPELDNAVKISKEQKLNVDNTKNHKLADSWDYRTVEFELGGKRFVGKINIANNKNGKMVYDVNKIKELPTNGAIARLGVGSSNPNIPNKTNPVNPIRGFEKLKKLDKKLGQGGFVANPFYKDGTGKAMSVDPTPPVGKTTIDPDIQEVIDEANKALKSGDFETAKLLGESLPKEYGAKLAKEAKIAQTKIER